jgi:hypothetical protein
MVQSLREIICKLGLSSVLAIEIEADCVNRYNFVLLSGSILGLDGGLRVS